jgi:TM2 domain-containing membrane protein YozV
MSEVQQTETNRSHRNWVALLVLSIFFGQFGVDRFYVGKIGTGIAKLAYFCIMLALCFVFIGIIFIWIWWLIDIVLILLGRFTDAEGKVVKS